MATGIENLRIYQKARELEKEMHIIIGALPTSERFNLIDQMRRASSSVVNNIAESYGKYHFGQKIQSIQIARGESYEIRSQIESAQQKRYLTDEVAKKLIHEYTELIKGISAYIKFLRSKRDDH